VLLGPAKFLPSGADELEMSSNSVFFNGQFVDPAEALVPVVDRGFLFGDGVYEVIPFYQGVPVGMAKHLDRLEYSLAEIALPNPYERSQWLSYIWQLVTRNGGGDLSVYIQVTRGAVAKRDHAFPPAETPATVVMLASPLHSLPAAVRQHGAAAITVPDLRWARCDIKSINLLPNIMARQQAVAAGAMEAIFLRDGQAIEGAASNLFVVRDGVILTPPKSTRILAGITRDLLLMLARERGEVVEETAIFETDLREADEIWLTSSTREIMPVTRLDEQPVCKGHIGPVWRRLDRAYQEYKQTLISTGGES